MPSPSPPLPLDDVRRCRRRRSGFRPGFRRSCWRGHAGAAAAPRSRAALPTPDELKEKAVRAGAARAATVRGEASLARESRKSRSITGLV